MYIDLRQLPALQNEEASQMFEEQRIRLNSLPQVDYEEVNKQKRSYLRMLFEQESENILTSESFEAFSAITKNGSFHMQHTATCVI